MHELHFMRDIASGSEFVLSVLRQVLPSEAILVQVFDINSRNFVVVRAFPDVREALLLRTADSDPVVRRSCAAPRACAWPDAVEGRPLRVRRLACPRCDAARRHVRPGPAGAATWA